MANEAVDITTQPILYHTCFISYNFLLVCVSELKKNVILSLSICGQVIGSITRSRRPSPVICASRQMLIKSIGLSCRSTCQWTLYRLTGLLCCSWMCHLTVSLSVSASVSISLPRPLSSTKPVQSSYCLCMAALQLEASASNDSHVLKVIHPQPPCQDCP